MGDFLKNIDSARFRPQSTVDGHNSSRIAGQVSDAPGDGTSFAGGNLSVYSFASSKEDLTPVPGFRRDRVTGVQAFCMSSKNLDSGWSLSASGGPE